VNILGLSEQDMADVVGVLENLPEIERVWLFGSRAKGTNKPGSDVDLALEGKSLSFDTVREVRFLLNEETCLPYRFDVLDRSTITSTELQDHINRVGLVVYERKGGPEGPPTT